MSYQWLEDDFVRLKFGSILNRKYCVERDCGNFGCSTLVVSKEDWCSMMTAKELFEFYENGVPLLNLLKQLEL